MMIKVCNIFYDSIKTYGFGTRKDLVNEKEEVKCNNIIKRYKK